ncbi:MAG: hypothetical protein VW644_06000, partial [Alphaproteobacteria bacterium]
RVTGPEAQRDALSKAGAEWTVDEVIVTNENIVTTGEQASNAARLDAFLALFDENPVQEAA